MSADRGAPSEFRMGPTRPRDLLAVVLVAAIAGYLLVRLNYSRFPPLPRFAGLAAAVLGVAEAIFGQGLRARIQADRTAGRRSSRPPVPPLTAARAVMAAKATALAGAALAGLWFGLLLYVLPKSGAVTAARSDTVTALLGLVCAVLMTAGALYLEFCCRAPQDPQDGRSIRS
jgi:hypothetical protein